MLYSKEVINAPRGSVRASMLISFQDRVTRAEAAIASFAKSMITEPTHALSWASDTFTNAAERDVALQVIHLLQHAVDVDTIRTVLIEGIMNKAQYINNKSTSSCSNFMEECMLAARVDAYEKFKYVTTLD